MTTIGTTGRLAQTGILRPWLVATRLLLGEKERTKAIEARASSTGSSTGNFIRHFLGMILAMMAGMMLLGAAVRMGTVTLGGSGIYDSSGLKALIMTTNMTIGMAVWMRHRGHNLSHITEMALAMFVPLAILIYPFSAGLLSRGALMGAMHVLMLPAMVGVMLYRRDVYSQHHRNHASSKARSHHTSH